MTEASLRLMPIETAYVYQESIRVKQLETLWDHFEQSQDWPYTVAWLDTLHRGRALFMRGRHAGLNEISLKHRNQPLQLSSQWRLRVPFNAPPFLLNRYSVGAFNFFYYHRQIRKVKTSVLPFDRFFFPLDGILNWNRIYGKKGFTQYQFVLPLAESLEGIREALALLNRYRQASFLSVLKRFGPADPNTPQSFPMEGYSLALDLKINKRTPELITQLDAVVASRGGRVYLAKDAFSARKVAPEHYGWGRREKFSSLQWQRLNPDL